MKRGKKIYKSISGMLFGFSLLAVPFSVLANVLETQEASEDTSETLVIFSEDSAFSVVIPKSIQLASNKSADYDIVVKGSIDKSGIVTVLPNDDVADVDGVNFIMENKLRPGMTVSADVIQDDGEWAEREVTYEGTIKSGSITARDLRVGQWEGTLTFNINYDTGAQAHVHSYISFVVKDATCTENGVKQFTCSCGDSYTEDILAAGHQYEDWVVTVQPTCQDGERKRKCTKCNKTELESVDPIYEHEGVNVTIDGHNEFVCKNCGDYL